GRLVVETVGGGEHEDRRAAAGGDDAFGDFVTGGSGDVSVEDGDVVGVDAQQLQSGVAVTCDICRDRFQAQAIADRVRHQGLVLDEQYAHAPDATSWRISSAYRKPDTCWQHDAAQTGGVPYGEPARTTTRRIRIRRIRVAGLLVVIAAIAAALGHQLLASSSSPAVAPLDVIRREHRGAPGEAVPSTVWPAQGQAAVHIGQSQVQAGPNQHAAAIASVAKVMAAYLVLRDHPLRLGEDGPTITLTDADVADTDRRRGQDESVVSIAAGERLTERQALRALLLPSANNIAAVLARWDAGSEGRFVARMNAIARSLGMTHTRYTDPSGYDDATVSTAADQVRIVDRAMRLPVFASIVATP